MELGLYGLEVGYAARLQGLDLGLGQGLDLGLGPGVFQLL